VVRGVTSDTSLVNWPLVAGFFKKVIPENSVSFSYACAEHTEVSVHTNSIVECNVTPCSLVETHPRFGGNHGFHCQGERVRIGLELFVVCNCK
jgi:hypothetical protein